MSLYVTVVGNLQYRNREDFEQAVKTLVDGGWVVGNNFVDECGDKVEECFVNIDHECLCLHIPDYTYHNLHFVLNDICAKATGRVTWYCLDGCFNGGIIVDGIETQYDLAEWAKTTDNVADEDRQPEDDTPEAYQEWRENVAVCFYETFN